ncbi:MAG TPA: SpoIIE family protein phosphatase [Vicinamibacterales bacterium]|nr:SpoIIE family protein phosphatase [Vicinamibacterales bacterium]
MTPPPRQLNLLRTLPGRLFLLSGALWLVLILVQRIVALPLLVEIFRKVVSLALIGSSAWLVGLTIARNRRRLLWRVRRKLILSYVFIGLFPVVLVAAFALFVSVVFYTDVAAYMFHEGFTDLSDNVQQFAETSAIEISRSPATAESGLERKVTNLKTQFSALSMAIVPVKASSAPTISAGVWQHAPVPAVAPAWVVLARGFHGVVPLVGAAGGDPHLVIRAAVLTADGSRLVIADLPVDTDVVARLDDRTSTRIRGITISMDTAGNGPSFTAGSRTGSGVLSVFQNTVLFMDCVDWDTGRPGRVSIGLDAPIGRLYEKVAATRSVSSAATGGRWADFLKVAAGVGVLLLIIQGAALFMGVTLARMITSAVHELFTGTERVQQGDFAHRVNITSRDQLGDLSESFNRMSASIEHLLHVQREKQRLDDELRIAREIQKSLLPVEPPKIDGLGVADLCEPAREVGGDYYDFFEIGPRQLGVLVADVSGKGTSAALYMAELKGLMLALSHDQRSPRRLLIDVNRRLAAHLDNRSFITMTYAVIDLDRGTLTSARAGHPPLIVAGNGSTEVVMSNGMVLGLRLPGAGDRFEELLEEHTRPIAPGDVIVLYTDGITEAMDKDGELFGDAALTRVVAGHHQLDAAGIRERVLREVKAFVGDAEPHDDMTMVVLKVRDDAAAS